MNNGKGGWTAIKYSKWWYTWPTTNSFKSGSHHVLNQIDCLIRESMLWQGMHFTMWCFLKKPTCVGVQSFLMALYQYSVYICIYIIYIYISYINIHEISYSLLYMCIYIYVCTWGLRKWCQPDSPLYPSFMRLIATQWWITIANASRAIESLFYRQDDTAGYSNLFACPSSTNYQSEYSSRRLHRAGHCMLQT